jgi:Ca2+:H+ antiporter
MKQEEDPEAQLPIRQVPDDQASEHSVRNVEEGEKPAAELGQSSTSTASPDAAVIRRKTTGNGAADDIDPSNPRPRRSGTSASAKQQKFTLGNQLRRTILGSWVNVLLIFVPVGIAVNYVGVDAKIVFVMNFIAIIPLAGLLSYATEEIALRVGETLGGLLNASFGNAVELIVSILARVKNEVLLVQTSLIGSILSNLLLVMGMCFFFGGINRMEQNFNITVAQTASSLLALAVGSLIIPTAFSIFSGAGNAGVVELSRGTAIILLVVYGCYLFFQLKSHASVFNEKSVKVEKRKDVKESARRKFASISGKRAEYDATQANKEKARLENENDEEDDDEPEISQLSLITALLTLGISTALVALCAEYLVGSIDQLTTESGISKTFVGLILLPIVGNAAEHATALTVACKDKMDLAIGVAVGSSMQIALLVIPFTVTLGWILHNDAMTLNFDGFQIAVVFVAILLVNYLIQDGKSNWLEGTLLMAAYVIISIAAWFYPAVGNVVG